MACVRPSAQKGPVRLALTDWAGQVAHVILLKTLSVSKWPCGQADSLAKLFPRPASCPFVKPCQASSGQVQHKHVCVCVRGRVGLHYHRLPWRNCEEEVKPSVRSTSVGLRLVGEWAGDWTWLVWCMTGLGWSGVWTVPGERERERHLLELALAGQTG